MMPRTAMAALRQCAGRQLGASGPLWSYQSRRFGTHVSIIGLHWKTDDVRLREVFAKYGELEKARVISPEHSSTHLWAALTYKKFDEAFEAVAEMNGQEMDGRILRVSIVDTTEDDEIPIDQ